MASRDPSGTKRRWRFYETSTGKRPVRDFLDAQTAEDAAEIVAEMKHVQQVGLRAARHLDGEIYEVRAAGESQIFRVLFAKEGRRGQILLALESFSKKTQKTPPAKVRLAHRRLADWRSRG